jgi:hypothetical protein
VYLFRVAVQLPRAKIPRVELPAADPRLDIALAAATPHAVELQLE